ncbi:hypothetical protein [Rhodoblastus sp.]|uniref:hypothetical protein n=1 Tax=Rhodoblastus sp. TaxID=1962975 RepID=UPI003F98B0DD
MKFDQLTAIDGERFAGRGGQGRQPLAAALALDDQKASSLFEGFFRHFGRRQRQGHQFRNAQAGGVKHLDQAGGAARPQSFAGGTGRIVEPFAGDAQKRVDFRDRQDFRQPPPLARPLQQNRRIVSAPFLGAEKTMKLPDRR